MTDAERLRILYALLAEAVERSEASAWRTLADGACREYRASRVEALLRESGQDVIRIEDNGHKGSA